MRGRKGKFMFIGILKKWMEMIAYFFLSESVISFSMLIIPTWRSEVELVHGINYIKAGSGVMFLLALFFYAAVTVIDFKKIIERKN